MGNVALKEDDEQTQARLRDTYLSQWTRYEPMEHRLEAWLAEPLSALHQAIRKQHIPTVLEPMARHQLAGV